MGGSKSYIGDIGKMCTLDATVLDIKCGSNSGVPWTMWKLCDDQGNIVHKFGELNPIYVTRRDGDRPHNVFKQVGIGDRVKFRAVVQNHLKYGSNCVTVIGRCHALSTYF